MNVVKKLGANWTLINMIMIIIGFIIIIYFDPIIEITHNILKMFISFLGMILIAVGNVGLCMTIIDNYRIGKKKKV